jgi:hypothetical protein
MIYCTFAVLYLEYEKFMADISCNLSLPLLKGLEEEKKKTGESTTRIVQKALKLYLTSKEEIHPERMLTQRDLDEIRKLLYPVPTAVPLSVDDIISNITQAEPKGLILPEVKEKDPDIKHSFHLHEIKEGPGVVNRLREAGINPLNIIKAKRAKKAGKEYNEELEQYFNLI